MAGRAEPGRGSYVRPSRPAARRRLARQRRPLARCAWSRPRRTGRCRGPSPRRRSGSRSRWSRSAPPTRIASPSSPSRRRARPVPLARHQRPRDHAGERPIPVRDQRRRTGGRGGHVRVGPTAGGAPRVRLLDGHAAAAPRVGWRPPGLAASTPDRARRQPHVRSGRSAPTTSRRASTVAIDASSPQLPQLSAEARARMARVDPAGLKQFDAWIARPATAARTVARPPRVGAAWDPRRHLRGAAPGGGTAARRPRGRDGDRRGVAGRAAARTGARAPRAATSAAVHGHRARLRRAVRSAARRDHDEPPRARRSAAARRDRGDRHHGSRRAAAAVAGSHATLPRYSSVHALHDLGYALVPGHRYAVRVDAVARGPHRRARWGRPG